MNQTLRFSMRAAPLLLLACTALRPADAQANGDAGTPGQQFMVALQTLCGKAFAGRITANDPPNPDDAFAGKPLVMHVRECQPDQMRMPFHVGEDRSRTWVLTRSSRGLRLKHDHRHRDGSEDRVTRYGGDTVDAGSSRRQQFPVDAFSKALFERESMNVSMTNTWAMEILPGEKFVYELARPGRLFRVEFDLGKTVAVPPAPWGAATGAE